MPRLIVTLLMGAALTARAQVTLIERLEMDVSDVELEGVYAFEEQEVAVIMTEPSKAKTLNRTLKLVDSELEEAGKTSIASAMKLKDISLRVMRSTGALHVAAHNLKKGVMEVHSVSIPSMEVKKRLVTLPKKTTIRSSGVLGNKMFTILSSSKQPKGKREYIGIIDLVTGKIELKFTDGFAGQDASPDLLEFTSGVDTMATFHVSNNDRKDYKYYILRYDREGNQIGKPWNLSGFKNNVTSASVTEIADNEYVVIGEYSQKSASAAEGLFFSRMSEDGKATDVQYFNFIEIPNFLDYLPERKAEKIEKKAEKKEEKGKELAFQYRTVTHSIILHEDELIMLAEFYYPTYRTEMYTTYVNGKPVTSYRTVFDGYAYTHALLAGLDAQGNMLWSNIFDIDIGYKPFSAIRVVKAQIVDDHLRLFNMKGSRLVATSYQNGRPTDVINRELIETGSSSDRIKYTVGSQVSHWYDEVFLIQGYQKIKGEDKRKVYHVTAVRF